MSPRVDAHSHLYPPSYRAVLRRAGVALPFPDTFGDAEAKLEFMDARGVDRAVVSIGNPWLEPLAHGVDEARRLNAELAGLELASGGRLLALGVLPHDSPEDAAAVAADVAAEQHLYGVASGTRICGLTLDDPRLEPLWDAVSGARLPVFVHPHHGVAELEGAPGGTVAHFGAGFPLETAAALSRLVLAGTLERFRDVRILAAHAGGALPALIGRLQAFWETREEGSAVPDPAAAGRRLYFDALGYMPAAVRLALDLVGPEQVLFGTDHPFPVARSPRNEQAVEHALADDDRELVYGAAATAFFGLPSG
jgi:predicted TIM-barrel fold metal-dependent hydrolase